MIVLLVAFVGRIYMEGALVKGMHRVLVADIRLGVCIWLLAWRSEELLTI